MVEIQEVRYQQSDIVNLIKQNIADLTDANPRDLKVILEIGRNHVAAKVFRYDKKNLEIQNEK